MAPQGQPPQRVVTPLGRHMSNQPLKSQRIKWIALSCVALLAMVVAFSGFALVRLRSNVQTAEMNIGELSSNLASGPLDILVIGSDTRAGNNGAYGTAEDAASGARSDVMMLVQVSEDRSNVNVISFPRDLMVDIPKCTDAETGEVYPATTETQINESLERGGPGCTVATISNLTGIAIDHFMLVDFNAVKALSSVVGGVEVCVTEPIDDTYSGLKLPAGTSSVEGEQALAFLRSRHGFGDGSDTARIQAQQSFLASLLRKVQAEGTLTNPAMLLNIAEAITQNVTIDKELTNLGNLVSIGTIFAKVDLSKVVFATVPNEPYTYDANKLQLSADSEAFFTKLQNDESLVEPAATASASASESSAPAAELTYSLGVSVTDATGVEDRAEELAPKIEQAGFTSVTTSRSDAVYTESAIYYPYGYEAEAQAIANLFGITSLTPSDQYVGIAVILGSDLAESDTIEAPQSEIAAGATGQTADQVTCQQSFSY
ncbi:MAG TPA: LCP family protein [Candidatus Rothia avistercoris]|uniref:LCP family protein n=1 Tax=Candidatus Rothia avistercoris TaxID=2840479 RepID=A0A9D2ZT56_9MICC|nr:LCP family protein [Candidatus Rothia avistercoris]